jgi:hypothetical protein
VQDIHELCRVAAAYSRALLLEAQLLWLDQWFRACVHQQGAGGTSWTCASHTGKETGQQ